MLGLVVIAIAAAAWYGVSYRNGGQTAAAAPMPLASVTVSKPLLRDVDTRVGFLGQFSAIDRVELRAQVGGTLTEIHFKDGQIVHKGDLLFVIDPRPYEIKLAQATAQLQTATSRLTLATSELIRAQALKKSNFGTAETVDQRMDEQSAAQAAIDDAKAQIRDAKLDLEYCHITAPFTGRIGARLVSIGSLIAGSRAATSPTTLLTTLVSLDPDLSRLRHERIRLSDLLARARASPRSGGRSGRDQPQRRDELRAAGLARLRRQCPRSLERHDPCPRLGAQSGFLPGARRVRADPPGGLAARPHPAACRTPRSCSISRSIWS